jgi:hypothetical protein
MWKLGLRPRIPFLEYINGIFVAVWHALLAAVTEVAFFANKIFGKTSDLKN